MAVVLSAGDIAPRTPAEESEHARGLEMLCSVAVSLSHDVDLDDVLAELASGVRRVLDAGRVSVLLLDDSERLRPAVAVARQGDDNLWQRFRHMPPVALDELPGARQALTSGRVLVIDDARTSPLVPSAWQRTFELGSLAVAPLMEGDRPAGLVAVEHGPAAAAFTPLQLTVLEGMVALAGIALRRIGQLPGGQPVTALTRLARSMTSARSTRALAEQALGAALEVARLSHGLFGVLSDGGVEVVAVRGPELVEPGRYALDDLPTELVTSCHQAWDIDQRTPVEAPAGHHVVTVLPVPGPHRPVAVIALPVALHSVPSHALEQLELIAEVTALALQGIRRADDREWHRRALALTTSAPSARTQAGVVSALVGEARSLLLEQGLTRCRVVADRDVARITGLPAATGDVAQQLGRWRRGARLAEPVRIGEEIMTPLRYDGRVVGTLLCAANGKQVLPQRAERGLALLGTLLGQTAAHERLTHLERTLADSELQRDAATRACEQAAQVVTALQTRVGTAAGPGEAGTRALVDQAQRLLRRAAEALVPPPPERATLRVALTALATRLARTGGPETVVRQHGRVPMLDDAVQGALLGTTHCLLGLLRDARAVAAVVDIEGTPGGVHVSIRADELLAPALDPTTTALVPALRDAQRRLETVGGSLELVHDGGSRTFLLQAPLGPAATLGNRQGRRPNQEEVRSTTSQNHTAN